VRGWQGQRVHFWSDRWIDGRSVQQLAPNLMAFVRPGANTMTVGLLRLEAPLQSRPLLNSWRSGTWFELFGYQRRLTR
jgi:hypothetical protein